MLTGVYGRQSYLSGSTTVCFFQFRFVSFEIFISLAHILQRVGGN